ncbi:MAG: hypothetical protein BM564_01150 [Bacteroidetes bacterium MedPE-SWsnd-G2]|nr:MAG: hypothetical protein BM564_01150 [Bacteroidetes bacterium MedPE-SWsnd-G2]
MDILKSATDWAKAEVFSTSFFILFGIIFMAASFGFWKLGKTDLARAYITPALVTGALLLIIGLGLFFTNISRISSFEKHYKEDASAFVQSELLRVEGTLKEYKTIVFTAIPVIIACCALLLIVMNAPVWRASLISAIAMLVVILLIDGMAHARIDAYNKQLLLVEHELKN